MKWWLWSQFIHFKTRNTLEDNTWQTFKLCPTFLGFKKRCSSLDPPTPGLIVVMITAWSLRPARLAVRVYKAAICKLQIVSYNLSVAIVGMRFHSRTSSALCHSIGAHHTSSWLMSSDAIPSMRRRSMLLIVRCYFGLLEQSPKQPAHKLST